MQPNDDPLPIDLALQGGGSHGAFTWGVLDRLLEESRFAIVAISGTSAGAMNAAVLADGWTEGGALSLWDAIEPFRAHGLKHVLCTDIERDGASSGPSLALYREAVRRFPDLAWQASGGVRDVSDLTALSGIGVAAAISGKALLEERMTSLELQPFLPNASSPASTSATAKS